MTRPQSQSGEGNLQIFYLELYDCIYAYFREVITAVPL